MADNNTIINSISQAFKEREIQVFEKKYHYFKPLNFTNGIFRISNTI